MSKLQDKLNGEHALATIGIELLPLIETHFKPFDGQRAILASGGKSAKFKTCLRRFRADAVKLSDARISCDLLYSARIDFDINRPITGSDCTVEYFRDAIYFGEIHSGNFQEAATGIFTYKLDIYAGDGYREKAEQILATTIDDIERVQQETSDALEQLRKSKDSISYVFRDLLPTY